MTDTEQVGKKHKKALTIIGVVLPLALAGGAGALLKFWQEETKVVPPKQVVGVSQDKAISGDFEGGQAEIDKALEREDLTAGDKYDLYYQKGTNFQNEGKNKEAMDNFKEALKYKKTYSLYHSMGMVAEATQDIQGAIDYYKAALPLVGAPPENPMADDDKIYLQGKIDALSEQL
jgi:tetratricopeptide (TPR) repeat protein